MAFENNFTAFKHAPWGGASGEGDIVIWGEDWSEATILWAFGSPTDLAQDFALSDVSAAGFEGVYATFNANYVHPISGEQGPATLLRPHINKSTLEGLLFEGVSDLRLEHTLYVTPAGGQRRPICFGTITVKQGVSDS